MPSRAGVKQAEPKTEQDDGTTIWTITGGQTERYHIHLNLDKQPIRMELNTGAAVSVMSIVKGSGKKCLVKLSPCIHMKAGPCKDTLDMNYMS